MLFSKYDYPLYTVMDEPEPYKGLKKTGLYFVTTINYVPMRGNGWYSLPMIEYCLEQHLIEEEDIKHVLYSSISIPHNYYNEFITYAYKTLGDYSKLSINCMIGMFKPKERENWKSLLVSSDPNTSFYHYLKRQAVFIDTRLIDEKPYYQVFESYMSNKLEAEAPIYNQILDLEAIELHKLGGIIREHQGRLLDLNTDAVICMFPNNLPFELDENHNIKGYYYDEEKTLPRYKMEFKYDRLKVDRMPGTMRREIYEYIKKT